MAAALALMGDCEIKPVVVNAAMLQSDRRRERLGAPWTERAAAARHTPILAKGPVGGWVTEN